MTKEETLLILKLDEEKIDQLVARRNYLSKTIKMLKKQLNKKKNEKS